MKIIFLDDNARACKTFDEWIHSAIKEDTHVTFATNLLDFDYELYESGDQYDKYILDLGLNKPAEFPQDEYEQWLGSIGITEPTYLNPATSVLGWDYYQKVMRVREATKDRLDRVMLKSGYVDLLVSKFGDACYRPATLLNKGDTNHNFMLKSFLLKE